MDALSEVLRTVRLTGAIFFDCSAQAPWVAEQPPSEAILQKVMPGVVSASDVRLGNLRARANAHARRLVYAWLGRRMRNSN